MATNIKAVAAGILFIMAVSTPAFSQRKVEFQFGVRGGVFLTDFLESDSSPTSEHDTFDRAPLTAGPTFEAVLYDRFLIQLDAMYRRVRMISQSVTPPGAGSFETRGASFEFPVIIDYYVSKGKWRPYAGLGIVAGHVGTGTLESHVAPGFPGAGTPFVGQFFMKTQLPAYVANGGLEWSSAWLAIRPEVRYTKWAQKFGLQIQQNQVEISIGISLRLSR